MTEQLITEIQRKMLPYLNNEQLMHLRDALAETLEGATITYDSSESRTSSQRWQFCPRSAQAGS